MVTPIKNDFVVVVWNGKKYAAKVVGVYPGAASAELRIFPADGSKTVPTYRKLVPYSLFPKEKHWSPVRRTK
jgi:hypothetical protein